MNKVKLFFKKLFIKPNPDKPYGDLFIDKPEEPIDIFESEPQTGVSDHAVLSAMKVILSPEAIHPEMTPEERRGLVTNYLQVVRDKLLEVENAL